MLLFVDCPNCDDEMESSCETCKGNGVLSITPTQLTDAQHRRMEEIIHCGRSFFKQGDEFLAKVGLVGIFHDDSVEALLVTGKGYNAYHHPRTGQVSDWWK